jgi:hypothetical protein
MNSKREFGMSMATDKAGKLQKWILNEIQDNI